MGSDLGASRGGGPCIQVVLRGFQISDFLAPASISTVTGGGSRLVDKGRVVSVRVLGETVPNMA